MGSLPCLRGLEKYNLCTEHLRKNPVTVASSTLRPHVQPTYAQMSMQDLQGKINPSTSMENSSRPRTSNPINIQHPIPPAKQNPEGRTRLQDFSCPFE